MGFHCHFSECTLQPKLVSLRRKRWENKPWKLPEFNAICCRGVFMNLNDEFFYSEEDAMNRAIRKIMIATTVWTFVVSAGR
jgi:hypothetical protein